MNVTIKQITKGKDGKIYVTLEHEKAINNPTLVFDFPLPNDIGLEFFSKASKGTMERMRGCKDDIADSLDTKK